MREEALGGIFGRGTVENAAGVREKAVWAVTFFLFNYFQIIDKKL